MPDTKLEAAYRNTTYHVDHPGGDFGIRIDARSASLDALLREHQGATWAFVSACNPRSQPLSAQENAARHARLRARVAESGWPCYAGRGRADRGDWVEQSLLIVGIDENAAVALGAAFGQHAVLVGRLGEAAQLKWCDIRT